METNKINKASEITKHQIVEKIKRENPDRYDQIVIDSEIKRNDIYYINFKSTYINFIPKMVTFAMIPSVKSHFQNNCCGGKHSLGEVCEVDKSFIKSIQSSNCYIDKKEYTGCVNPNPLKSHNSYQYLRRGLITWNDPSQKIDMNKNEKKHSLIDDFKNVKDSLTSTVKTLDDTLVQYGDVVNDSLKSLDELRGNSESKEYAAMKLKYFPKINLNYYGEEISDIQPTYFIPELTWSESCSTCRGESLVICDSCGGRHEYKCPSCHGKGYLKCDFCSGSGIDRQSDNRNAKCKECNGSGERKCSSLSQSNLLSAAVKKAAGNKYCGGKGTIVCKECYGDPSRYGKVDCKPCKATGEIGRIVYIEIEVGKVNGEFYKHTNEIIDQIQKSPDILFKYLNKSEINHQIVYNDVNGVISEKYDLNSEGFSKNIEEITGLKKKELYPRIISEEIYYDIIPISTLDYNHILSGTIHKVSAVPIPNLSEFDIIFHSNPTAVNKFDIGNVFKSLGWKFKKAFSTKGYKEKLDKKHELFLLVRVAKADGIIEDSEKRVLVDLISNLKEFSNNEKTEFFNLFSLKEMPPIKDEEIVFSTKERAQTVIHNLKKMMKEDGEIESPEVKLIATLQEKINSNIGNYPSFTSSFFKTWEISVPLIALLVSLIAFSIYFLLFSNESFNEEIVFDEPTVENIEPTKISTADPEESFDLNENSSVDFSSDSLESVDISDSIVSLEKGIATVSVERSFFYQNPDISTKKNAYLIEGQDVEFSNRNGDFIYCKFINSKGILTEGWMLSADFRNERPILDKQKKYKIIDPDGFSNLRVSPNGNIIRKVMDSETFEVLGSDGAFKRVKLSDGTEGFIHESRVVEIK